MTNAAAGQHFKQRTKVWLESCGYQVAYLERIGYLPTGPVKRDQFASDLLAVSLDDVVFVQVRSGRHPRAHLAEARRAFERFTFPPGTQRWVVCWPPGASAPEIVVVSVGPVSALAAAHPPTTRRSRTKALPLFQVQP